MYTATLALLFVACASATLGKAEESRGRMCRSQTHTAVCSPRSGLKGFSQSKFLIETESDMDAMYAGCTTILGNLEIICSGAADLLDLEALQSVTDITGYLVIQNCPLITTLNGLRSLQCA